ncbi:putative quinol monooxygenase [Peribacillus sp. SCS-155]|uniref:putative quinol monooxygenase n=1 Tax=Peribacillus sedimenti TaxID=3115297 RepID=UPI003905DD38
MQKLLAASCEENGNISYNLYKNTENNNVFTMVEVWKELRQLPFITKAFFTSFIGKAKEFLTAPLDVKAFDGQPAKL